MEDVRNGFGYLTEEEKAYIEGQQEAMKDFIERRAAEEKERRKMCEELKARWQ